MDRLYNVMMTTMIATDTSVICVLLKIRIHATLKRLKRTFNYKNYSNVLLLRGNYIFNLKKSVTFP